MGFFKLGCDKRLCANIPRVKCPSLVHFLFSALPALSFVLAVFYPFLATIIFKLMFFSKSVQVHSDDDITNVTKTYGYLYGYEEEYCFVNASRWTCLNDQKKQGKYSIAMTYKDSEMFTAVTTDPVT